MPSPHAPQLTKTTFHLRPDEILFMAGFAERCDQCGHAEFFHYFDPELGIQCNVGGEQDRCRCAVPGTAEPVVEAHMKREVA